MHPGVPQMLHEYALKDDVAFLEELINDEKQRDEDENKALQDPHHQDGGRGGI